MTASGEEGVKPIPVFTIGYGDRSIESFIETLKSHDIAYLIDVRSAPYSRYRPEFSKESLENALRANGIRYVFMGAELGGRPEDPDCYENGKVRYEIVRQKAFYQEGIGRIQSAFAQQQRVVLMCSEGRPENCHRVALIGESLVKKEIPVAHIDERGEIISHLEAVNRRTGGQMSLFGSHDFSSRKRYQGGSEENGA
jgi:uncharacterized protein (DUF488 family)